MPTSCALIAVFICIVITGNVPVCSCTYVTCTLCNGDDLWFVLVGRSVNNVYCVGLCIFTIK